MLAADIHRPELIKRDRRVVTAARVIQNIRHLHALVEPTSPA